MTVLTVFAFIMAGYLLCLAWALRNESTPHLIVLAGLVGVAAGLRLCYPHTFPWGFNEDELKVAISSLGRYCDDSLYGELPNNMQAAVYAATFGPAYEWFGLWWGIRAYSALSTTLAVALAYGIGRQLGLSPVASLAGCAVPFVALPWALLYGRTGIGGEVMLNGLIVIFALLKCATARGWHLASAAALLWFGLLLSLFGYTAGKVFLVVAAVATLTFPRDRWFLRAGAVAVACSASALLYGSVASGDHVWYGFSSTVLPPESRPASMVLLNWQPLITFLWKPLPRSVNVAQSIPWVHVLPLPVLAVVGTGMLIAFRRRVTAMLLIAFIIGLLPALLGPNSVSSRRLLPAAIVVPMFLGLALDRLGSGWLRTTAAGALAITILVWGPTRFFEPDRWTRVDKLRFCNFGCPLFAGKDPRGLPLRYGPLPIPKGCADSAPAGAPSP